jgi:hypothetical protein
VPRVCQWYSYFALLPKKIGYTQTLSDLGENYIPIRPVQVKFCASNMSVHTCSIIYIYIIVQLKHEIQHTWTWPARAWQSSSSSPPRGLCYCPTVLSHHLHITKLSFLQTEIRRALLWRYLSLLLTFYTIS